MIILHTADWHIGQNFFGYERQNEHIIFFEWLKETVKKEDADVLLIAGDVFDSPNPSAASQKIFYRLLKELSTDNPNLQTVIIAGNHDSAARLEAPDPLLEEMNVFIRGNIKRKENGEIDYQNLLIPLKSKNRVECWCMAVPYLRQGDYPTSDNYAKGVAAMYTALFDKLSSMKDLNQGIIAMGHLHASGAEISENDRSERTVMGGLECVSPEAFDEAILYTALGHLHKIQRVSGRENVRYAGSPLPMSFAEKNYKQGVNRIEIENTNLLSITRIDFTPPVELLSLPQEPQTLPFVLDIINSLPEGEITDFSPYLELKVLIEEPEPSLRHKIEEALEGKSVRLARLISFVPKQKSENKKLITYEELKTINPIDMADDFYRERFGNNMPGHLKELLFHVINETEK